MAWTWGLSQCQSARVLQKAGTTGSCPIYETDSWRTLFAGLEIRLESCPSTQHWESLVRAGACTSHRLESKSTLPTQFGRAKLRSSQNTFLRTWGPVGLGQTAPLRARWWQRPCSVRTRSVCAGPGGREGGHSLVVVVFHKLLELFDVAYGLQVLLHMGQGREVICQRGTKPRGLSFPSPGPK